MLSDGTNNHILYVPQAPNPYLPPEYTGFAQEEKFGNVLVKRRLFPERGSRRIPVFDYLGDMAYHDKFAESFLEHAHTENVDLVYGHTPLHFGYAAMKMAKKNKLPFVHEAHAFIHDTMINPYKKGVKHFYHKMFQLMVLTRERSILHNANAVIAQTDTVKARIVECYRIPEQKIVVIRNGVDTNHFNPAKYKAKGQSLRKKMGWGNKKVFLYTGLFDHINGIDFYLEALRKIPPNIQERMVAVFLGRGPLQDDVKSAAELLSHVQYLGKAPYEEMPEYYAAADIFVIPRPSCEPAETLMPMKLYEAMSMEIPVLVSNVMPMEEAVCNGTFGYLYPKGNMDKFIESILYQVMREDDNRSMVQNARQKVVSNHSWENAHKALQEVYTSIILSR